VAVAPAPTLGLDELRRKATAIHKDRLSAVEKLRELLYEAAETERLYRKTRAIAFATARGEGKGVGESEITADGASVDARFDRDIAAGMVTAQREYLALLERDAATLRQVADWSQRVDSVAA